MAEQVESICIPFTHTYDQFTTFFYDGRVYLSDTSYPIGQCCVDIVNMDEEVLEPPAFWFVGCLKGKSESFRLRFVLFTTIRSVDFPLFPSSPARFFRILGQKWVKHDAPAPPPTAPRSPSHRRQQSDRPRRPRRWRSPAEYR